MVFHVWEEKKKGFERDNGPLCGQADLITNHSQGNKCWVNVALWNCACAWRFPLQYLSRIESATRDAAVWVILNVRLAGRPSWVMGLIRRRALMWLHHKVMWTRSLMPGLDKHHRRERKTEQKKPKTNKKTSGIPFMWKVAFTKQIIYFLLAPDWPYVYIHYVQIWLRRLCY